MTNGGSKTHGKATTQTKDEKQKEAKSEKK